MERAVEAASEKRGVLSRLRVFMTPWDGRFEDLRKGVPGVAVLRDVTAGLVVAMVAIPLAMGFAMASGLRPEQGIVGGAVAGLVGALFGGSKYQVYGPTAAFIPMIGSIMERHDHGFLVACSVLAGACLWALGLAGFGRHVNRVPHSIVVGFTIGIAFTIASSQLGEVLGVHMHTGYNTLDKLRGAAHHFGELNLWAVVLALGTLWLTQGLLKVSSYLPAPLLSLAAGVGLTQTVLRDAGLDTVRSKYGAIPAQGLHLTPPALPELTPALTAEVAYFALGIVFVSAIESLLCSRMADRLANNTGKPFDPDKELWGQGHVMVLVPLLNGFPHTGALARTATNIKLGAVSPLAGICKFAFKLLLAFYLAHWLELVPMACIGGILLYVARNMVKPEEVREVLHLGRGHTRLMAYTAVSVVLTDFLKGVLSALAIYIAWQLWERRQAVAQEAQRHDRERAALGASLATARKPTHHDGSDPSRVWLSHLRQRAQVARSAFVHHKANVAGRVVLGDHVHIAAAASVRADEGTPFFLGDGTNIQDGAVLHALRDRHVTVDGERWAVYLGRSVSVAHDALVHGPCFVGDETFVGFKAVVHDAVVGPRCFLGIGSVVVGVELPEGRYVPPGAIIDSPEKVAALAPVTEAQREFNHDVVEVNRGLATAYRAHRDRAGGRLPAAVEGHDGAAGWEPPKRHGRSPRLERA